MPHEVASTEALAPTRQPGGRGGTARAAAPRRERVEPGPTLHRLDGRRPERRGRGRSRASRRAPPSRGLGVRLLLYVGTAARDAHGRDRPADHAARAYPGRADLAAERTPLRCAPGHGSVACDVPLRTAFGAALPVSICGAPAGAGAGRSTLPRLRPALRGRAASDELPRAESHADTLARLRPYWVERIAPELARGRCILVVSHKNTLRALAKLIEGRADAEVRSIRVPTGVPLVFVPDQVTPERWYRVRDR